jgi:hypothetical protein
MMAVMPRRAALRLPVMLATATMPAAAGPVHPDAEIIQMADTLLAGHAEARRLTDSYVNVVQVRYPQEVARRVEELSTEYHELRQRLGAAVAVTPSGFRAKARALMLWFAPGGAGDEPCPESDEYLAWSLCRDLLHPCS